jgi:hypothetical protein
MNAGLVLGYGETWSNDDDACSVATWAESGSQIV